MEPRQVLSTILTIIESDSDDESDRLHLNYSSSSSEDEDDVHHIISETVSRVREDRRKIPRIEGYVEKTVVRYNKEEFKQHFRVYPETFEFIFNLIGPKIFISCKRGNRTIDPKKQLLIMLWMMATPDSYRSVCEKFDVGRATALRTMRRGAHALFCLAPKFIHWPTGEQANAVSRQFERYSGFPNAIGAIDGTHIQIYAPKHDGVSYINRKGTHSIQMQAVCTQQMLFTSVYAGHSGRVHDARVFKMSPVQKYIDNPDVYFERGRHLVGDAAYGIDPCLIVPYKDNGHLTQRQKNFNFCLSSARVSIERAFGLLKTRWRSILDCLPMTTLEKIPEYLVALTVLHNICVLKGDLIPIENNLRVRQRGALIENPQRKQQGLQKRYSITNSIIIRNN